MTVFPSRCWLRIRRPRESYSKRYVDDHLHAVLLQQLGLLFGLGHVAHQHDLRLKRQNLLNVGLRAGLHDGQFRHGFRIIAIFAAADERVSSADGAENLTVGRRERDNARRGRIQRNLAAVHIGDGNAVGQRERRAAHHQRSQKQGKKFLGHDTVPPQKILQMNRGREHLYPKENVPS